MSGYGKPINPVSISSADDKNTKKKGLLLPDDEFSADLFNKNFLENYIEYIYTIISLCKNFQENLWSSDVNC